MAQEKTKQKDDIQKTKKLIANQDSNRLMGMAAIFISLLSLFAVLYQSYLSREENELIRVQQSASVLPYLSSWYSDIDGHYKFVIANKGVGPAFIKKVEFYTTLKNNRVFNSSSDFYECLRNNSNIFDTTEMIHYRFRSNVLMTKNESRSIFSFSYVDKAYKKLLKEEFNRLFEKIYIEYEDVYGTSWIYDSEVGHPEKK